MCASEIFVLLLVVVAVVLLFSLLMLLLVLFAAVVVLVPSFFGDDAPFAEDILLKERSPFEFSLVVVGKKNVYSSSVFEWLWGLLKNKAVFVSSHSLFFLFEENKTL